MRNIEDLQTLVAESAWKIDAAIPEVDFKDT